MVSTVPNPAVLLGRAYCEDCTVQQGVVAWLIADGHKEVCIVCGSHVWLPFNQGHVWTDVLQCTAESMHVVVALQSVTWGNRRVHFRLVQVRLLKHVVECMDQAQSAMLALGEGDTAEHAHVRADLEATRVCASSARGGVPPKGIGADRQQW